MAGRNADKGKYTWKTDEAHSVRVLGFEHRAGGKLPFSRRVRRNYETFDRRVPFGRGTPNIYW